jgi:hypothetical protein
VLVDDGRAAVAVMTANDDGLVAIAAPVVIPMNANTDAHRAGTHVDTFRVRRHGECNSSGSEHSNNQRAHISLHAYAGSLTDDAAIGSEASCGGFDRWRRAADLDPVPIKDIEVRGTVLEGGGVQVGWAAERALRTPSTGRAERDRFTAAAAPHHAAGTTEAPVE